MREGYAPPLVNLNVINSHGGLGDLIARLPAMRYLHDTYLHTTQTIYSHDYAVDLLRFLLPDTERLTHKRLSECPYGVHRPIIKFDSERLTTLHLHLTDHAFLIMMDMLPPSEEARAYQKANEVVYSYMQGRNLNHLTYDNKWNNFIVFTTDFTAKARVWPSYEINTLAHKVKAKGLQPVLVGKKGELSDGQVVLPNDGIDSSLFLDLRDKTSLIEALGVIQRAKAVVGVDNGLIHLAACTDVPIVVGYTSLKAKDRLPVRPYGAFKVVEAQLPCGGCQSRGFAINMDWRQCLFEDYACTMTMTADRFYKGLEELGVL